MPNKTDPAAISPKVLSSLFARFTADRDALYAALERCEQRLVELSERVEGPPAATNDAMLKAEEALAVAKEALLVAREALAVVRHRR
ncbi:MAG TPA: hypothetical protein VNO26_07800 [Candidatus Limnocylindria bacterium]|nr:hypothetical protein [Candidatus Limnocylindria bacterium]